MASTDLFHPCYTFVREASHGSIYACVYCVYGYFVHSDTRTRTGTSLGEKYKRKEKQGKVMEKVKCRESLIVMMMMMMMRLREGT